AAPRETEDSCGLRAVLIEMAVADLDGIEAGKLPKTSRQVPRLRHFRASEQHGDDARSGLERGDDLRAHQVVLAGQPPVAVRVRRRDPAWADQREENIRLAHLGANGLEEIRARVDAVEVAIDPTLAEPVGEPVEEPAGMAGGIVTAVADEDAHHHGPRFGADRSAPARAVALPRISLVAARSAQSQWQNTRNMRSQGSAASTTARSTVSRAIP